MVSSINSSYDLISRLNLTEMKQRSQEMFTKMDTNGDGAVDKAEFSAFGKLMAEQIGAPDRSEEMFTKMDTSGDGSIDKAEFIAFGQEMAQRIDGPDRSEEIFSEIDTDGNGTISQAEMEAFRPTPPPMGADAASGVSGSRAATGIDVVSLLDSINNDDEESRSSWSFRAAIEQYAGSFGAQSESLLDVLG